MAPKISFNSHKNETKQELSKGGLQLMGMCGGGPEAKGRDPRGTPDGRRGGGGGGRGRTRLEDRRGGGGAEEEKIEKGNK
jgi:hypothetical protein